MSLEFQLPPRERLLQAAVELLANSDGAPVSTRKITELAGVTAPTLYHHFGDKEGLFDAVVAVGFDQYVASETGLDPTGKPLDDVRRMWDQHVRFGIEQPHMYLVMFGNVRPGNRSNRLAEAEALLRDKLDRAAEAGHLNVAPADAVRSILAANIGVTLMLIAEPAAERNFELSDMTRDAVITAVSSEAGITDSASPVETSSVVVAAIALNAALESSNPQQLSNTEMKMFLEWLHRISKTS